MSDQPFTVNLGSLKSKSKTQSPEKIQAAEQAGERLGFVDRKPAKKRGRKPSPRTGQVHAKVMPEITIEIANEANRRGVTQGVIIEEAWALYKNKSGN